MQEEIETILGEKPEKAADKKWIKVLEDILEDMNHEKYVQNFEEDIYYHLSEQNLLQTIQGVKVQFKSFLNFKVYFVVWLMTLFYTSYYFPAQIFMKDLNLQLNQDMKFKLKYQDN